MLAGGAGGGGFFRHKLGPKRRGLDGTGESAAGEAQCHSPHSPHLSHSSHSTRQACHVLVRALGFLDGPTISEATTLLLLLLYDVPFKYECTRCLMRQYTWLLQRVVESGDTKHPLVVALDRMTVQLFNTEEVTLRCVLCGISVGDGCGACGNDLTCVQHGMHVRRERTSWTGSRLSECNVIASPCLLFPCSFGCTLQAGARARPARDAAGCAALHDRPAAGVGAGGQQGGAGACGGGRAHLQGAGGLRPRAPGSL